MKLLARFVLAGFLLSLGVAIASPAVHPPRLEMICSGGTMTLLTQGDADTPAASLLECPLCLPGSAPAPCTSAGVLPGPAPALPALHRGPLPPLKRATAPPPARGPPLNASLS